jgi:hypothetical protein
MRFSAAVVAILSAGLTGGLSILRAEQSVVNDDGLDVPGNSPLKFCDKPHDEDIVTIMNVDLLPNPPEASVPEFTDRFPYEHADKFCAVVQP